MKIKGIKLFYSIVTTLAVCSAIVASVSLQNNEKKTSVVEVSNEMKDINYPDFIEDSEDIIIEADESFKNDTADLNKKNYNTVKISFFTVL